MATTTRACAPALRHYLRFVATTMGRDKLLRTAQYFSQFYAWHLYRRNHQQSAIDPYTAAQKQLIITRKILRIGNFLENLQAVAQILSKKNSSEPVLKYLAIGSQLGFGGYLVLDNITALEAIGIHKFPFSKRVPIAANRLWAVGLVCSAITSIYILLHPQPQRTTTHTTGEQMSDNTKRSSDRSAACMQLISDLCDLTAPGSSLGVFKLSEGVVGMAGTMSSLVGVWNQWKKTE
ncbi:peroxisomal biogenesis factor 11 [Aspergillus bertholletiae]|uniref:Peroxisomal biogenesis factor 11 n=1 Tax=Aspergillus bertholletiae TaxID=1226010 RepID=A0A5N7B8U3_9EURO|nr:peroxisomal biogenesis factor 11 [Aspergillus bertholletiae]